MPMCGSIFFLGPIIKSVFFARWDNLVQESLLVEMSLRFSHTTTDYLFVSKFTTTCLILYITPYNPVSTVEDELEEALTFFTFTLLLCAAKAHPASERLCGCGGGCCGGEFAFRCSGSFSRNAFLKAACNSV